MEAIALEAKAAMEKTIVALQTQFNTLRTGRANAALLDRVMVDYYGEPTPINQIASIAVPEPRQLLIKPYDKGDIKAIIEGINKAELGINPVAEGDAIRLVLPALTEDRRKELAKQAKRMADEAKVAIRNIRKDFLALVTDDEYTEDLKKRIEADMTKVYDQVISQIDASFLSKEKEILTL
ncbi:MAG: ribosome recycling factor [Bacilli bacterium]